jgi:hypothetical protein
MGTIKVTAKKPDDSKKKVAKTETVEWDTDIAVNGNQYLKIVLDSSYGTNVGVGGKGESFVKLPLSFPGSSSTPNVNVSYSLFRVTTDSSGTITATDVEIAGTPATGPYLVIDDIGKPPGSCQGDKDHHPGEEEHRNPHGGCTEPETEMHASGRAQG